MRAQPPPWWVDLVHPVAPGAIAALLVAFASLGCPAPRPARDPRMAGPVQPAARPMANAPCAQVAPVTCRYDATRLVLRLTAKRRESRSCQVRITGASANGGGSGVAISLQEEGAVALGERDASLFGGWGRPAKPGAAWESATVHVEQIGEGLEGPTRFQGNLLVPCRPGFGEDTQPPAEVAR